MTRTQILALVWLLTLFGTFWAGWSWRGDIAAVTEARAELKQSKGEARAVEQARAVEHSKSAAMADIGERHEQDRQATEAVPDSVVADLRADRYRLRGELASCETRNLSSAAATASQRDAEAVSREEIAGAAVRIARDSDDQLRACQAVVVEDRK